jgi:hypothetical protein
LITNSSINILIADEGSDLFLFAEGRKKNFTTGKCILTTEGIVFYCFLEDGIQYQMSLKYFLQLKKFLHKSYNMNMKLPINSWYRQLQREDKNEVIIKINKSYSIKT